MIAHGYWTGPGWWGVVGGVVSILFFVLVVVLIASLLRNRPRTGTGASSSAVRILEERYARGEISRDEFLQRRAALSGSAKEPPPPPP
jgi:putative membrane protein